MQSPVLHLYCRSEDQALASEVLTHLKKLFPKLNGLEIEYCYNVGASATLNEDQRSILKWILARLRSSSVELSNSSCLAGDNLLEVGPRLNFSTPFSTNAVSICNAIGLCAINRIELSTRYLVRFDDDMVATEQMLDELASELHDRMTECRYTYPIETFDSAKTKDNWYYVDVLKQGRKALEKINHELGLSFDESDLTFYTKLFRETMKRNPTNVECFDLAQSNSEHCRHWFFKGKLIIDGFEECISLMEMVQRTQSSSNRNNVIKFCDNSSAITGFNVFRLIPQKSNQPSCFEVRSVESHLIFTAETHNFPTAVSPFSGSATGTSGRIRDVQAIGRGGHPIAATAGYSVGNLFIEGYPLPWEDANFTYPFKFAKPLEVLIDASNGASDYGNKFGEPVIAGFTRSFGLLDNNSERREFVKPIMFTGGIGIMDAAHSTKVKPEKGMKVVKIGGPVYRIGVGGGSASSTQIQGDNKEELDFGAVQRGDAEMEQKLNRVIRACLELNNNPILSIHDQGAGGNGNVLKEIVEPEGAIIFAKAFSLGDPTISTMELWSAEYQESNAILCNAHSLPVLREIASRERCPIDVVGTVTGNGRIVLTEEFPDPSQLETEDEKLPVDLDLRLIANAPTKAFNLTSCRIVCKALIIPKNLTVFDILKLVLKLPSVGSKRFLTNKVDRSVTGLIAQQQCVGPLHTPVADVAVTAVSYYDTVGIASSIGEQPIIGLLDPSAGARMSVSEALTNLVMAPITALEDVKCSGNWMWPAKMDGEGVNLYSACKAMCDAMSILGIAIDGGKDSLSMATRLDDGTTVKSPGTIVVSTYAPCTDIRKILTPDLKYPSFEKKGCLIHVDVSCGKVRLGGSALAQCFSQLGSEPPDLDSPIILKKAFKITQQLISEGHLFSGHDISDGGLITCLLEMAFAGICGLNLDVSHKWKGKESPLQILFAEEAGWVFECDHQKVKYIVNFYRSSGVACDHIGFSEGYGMDSNVTIKCNELMVLDEPLHSLLTLWEETSFRLEKLQADVECASKEFELIPKRTDPAYSYLPLFPQIRQHTSTFRLAVIREEGSNGDREMVAAFDLAGFEVWDVTMQDLINSKITLNSFRGIAFPGGFSYADVLGSAVGWAANILLNENVKRQFKAFYQRSDTFSFGVCNGCQLMCLLGWTDLESSWMNTDAGLSPINTEPTDVTLAVNKSGRFESRFSAILVQKSPSIMLSQMEGCVLGIWVAHTEGRFVFKDESTANKFEEMCCSPMKYVDDDANVTETYPFNPNGSAGGVAAVCSPNGRHLAMMPHPERCITFWQWPYITPALKERSQNHAMSPWFQMFKNARMWCDETT